MTKQEIIKQLEILTDNVANELTYINAKHDVLVNELCFLNNLLERARGDDSDG